MLRTAQSAILVHVAMQIDVIDTCEITQKMLLHSVQRIDELIVRHVANDSGLTSQTIHCPSEKPDIGIVVLVLERSRRILRVGFTDSRIYHLIRPIFVVLDFALLPHIVGRIADDHSDGSTFLPFHTLGVSFIQKREARLLCLGNIQCVNEAEPLEGFVGIRDFVKSMFDVQRRDVVPQQ